jgi:hypothetical protein
MSDPIIYDWIPLAALGTAKTFKITGANLTLTTRFGLKDVTLGKASPAVWSPSDPMPATVTPDGTQATIHSTQNGGTVPATGQLQLGLYGLGGVTPTQTITKSYPYSGMLQVREHERFPVIVDFAPETFCYGKEVALLLTGVHFSETTEVFLNEVYVHGVCWRVDTRKLVGHQLIVVIAHLSKNDEPLPGPGYLDVTVIGEDKTVKTQRRKLITYKTP